MMDNMKELLSRCMDAADGELEQSKLSDLAEEVCGAIENVPVIGRNIAGAANQGEWNRVVGGLKNYIDTSEASSKSTTISATATASATANSYAEAVAGIEALDSLDEKDKAEIEKLMLEVKVSEDKSILKHAAKTLVDKALEKGIETLPYVLPVIIETVQRM